MALFIQSVYSSLTYFWKYMWSRPEFQCINSFSGSRASVFTIFVRPSLYDLDLWPIKSNQIKYKSEALSKRFVNLENFGSWREHWKYLYEFWLKSLQWFMSYRVQKISISVADWPWSLTPWPWKCHWCHVDLAESISAMSVVITCPPFRR